LENKIQNQFLDLRPNRKFILFTTLGIFLLLCPHLPESFSHGLSSEILQSDVLNEQGVTLQIYSTASVESVENREITFQIIDSDTKQPLNNVTLLISVTRNNEKVHESVHQADDGILNLDLELKSNTFSDISDREIEPIKQRALRFENIPLLLSTEVLGGLYNFQVQIKTVGSYSDVLEEPIIFESGLSFPSTKFFEIQDSNYGSQKFGLIGYYDELSDFEFDSQERAISFSMPYSWPEHKKDEQFFVHNEILIPRTHGDLRYENFSAYVNGIDQTESVFNVDFALEEFLQVHLVTDWEQFNDLSEKLEDENGNRPSVLEYLFVPTDPDAPFSSLTHGGRYKINLSWEPKEITSGSETTFFIEILDIYTKDKPVPTDYHFTVIHRDEEIFHKSDISTDPETKTTQLDFLVPEDVSGPITIRFENLGGGIFSNLDFPAIVHKSDSAQIPDWVRNTAKWWSLTQISDQDFVKGLEYLIKNGMIRIPENQSSEGSSESELPSWLRKNAGWWSQGLLSDKDFFKSIQWLINNGFIKI
jgi:hypothetical protein